MVIPFATTSFRTTVHFFVGTEFPYLRWPEVYPLLSIYLLYNLRCSVSFVLLFHLPALFSSFFLRFEIYDDARTRALASSDYVYDLIEGSQACGRKCSCTPLYNLLIYKIPTVPNRTLISDSGPVLLVEASCFVAYISPALQRLGSWVGGFEVGAIDRVLFGRCTGFRERF